MATVFIAGILIADFSTGIKWRQCHSGEAPVRYNLKMDS